MSTTIEGGRCKIMGVRLVVADEHKKLKPTGMLMLVAKEVREADERVDSE